MSRSSTDAGLAGEAQEDWDPRNERLPHGLTPGLKVQRGDRVWVFTSNQGYGYSHLLKGDSSRRGWVLLSVLKKGKKRVEPLPIELPAESTDFGQSTGQKVAPAANILQETLRDLWRSIKTDEANIKAAIPAMTEKSKDIFFHPKASKYADAIYDFLTPEARDIMGNGNFSVDQLKTLEEVSDDWPKQPGIYLILYEDFGGAMTGDEEHHLAIYVGQTVNFQARLQGHTTKANTGNKSIHYRLASKAGIMTMVPLMLQANDKVPPSFLDIAEFSMVCLLRSWYALLFKPDIPSALGAYSTDFEGCLVFSRLMRQVQNRTNWRPNRTYGLNWHTPVLKHPKANQPWTAWYEETDSMHIYRSRRNLVIGNNTASITWNTESIQIPWKVAQDANFQNGQAIHLVVEVRKTEDGQYLTHPFRYARFPPNIGRNPALEKLRSLAVLIQWLPDGEQQWKQYYIERSRLWVTIPQVNPPVVSIYRQGLMMLCDVERTVYNNAPNWVSPIGNTQVQFLRYNHLEQKMVMEVVQTRTLQWPQDNTMQQNQQRLVALFPPNSNPDTMIGRQPPPNWLAQHRKACDMCLSQRTTTKCNYNPNDRSCQCCRALNRPCTFSRGGSIMDEFVHGKRLEELGIAVNVSRQAGSASSIDTAKEPPFDPVIEREEHGNLEEA